MGYTHYFKQNKPISDQQWQAFKKDAEIILDYIQNQLGIVLTSNDSNGIIINDNRVNMNGDKTYGLNHETFYLEKDYKDFNFCKTAHKPYDLAVCSLLLLAHEHMPGHYNIHSDGNLDEWKEAMELNANLLGRAYKLPESIDNSEKVRQFERQLEINYSIKKSKLKENKSVIKHFNL
jgi:hypothetical protein